MADAATRKKNEGNEYFKVGDYPRAVASYSEAIDLQPTNAVLYSNRSAAYAGMSKWTEAAEDGKRCVELDPTFVKGYHRAGNAMLKTKDLKAGIALVEKGLAHGPGNADLLAVLDQMKREFAAAERIRLSSLGREEMLKEEANKLFQAARFEDAIAKYTQAADAVSDKTSPLYLTILNNRAACHQQLSNFPAVVEDTSHVIEHDPHNVKALLRRGLAFEGLERYRSALADIRAVLAIDPSMDIANKAQHRIGAAVRQLKKGE